MSAEEKKSGRVYDVEPSQLYAEFMKTGWAPSPLHGITPDDVATYAFSRRQALSLAFPGVRLILPSGNYKVRSNDTDYLYRPHSAFAYYTGVQGVEATADAVLVMEPSGDSHEPILFINPRSTRDTDAFYKDARYGELWVGRRFTLEEAQARYQIATRKITELETFLAKDKGALVIREQDKLIDSIISKSVRDEELANFTSVHRMIKDDYEIKEMQQAIDATHSGFNDIIRALPAAVETPRGERVVEAAFYGRARIEGNDLGYNTIAASGAHACVLHWTRNDGAVRNGELILIDAGIEMDSYYTADITRTLPVNGKFTPEQRAMYMLVYRAQQAGFAAVEAGADFLDINRACHRVIAQGLHDLGVLTVSVDESMQPEIGLHRRWTLHGVSHMLGMDVHDCAQARKDQYTEAKLRAGMILTVEPGFYIQPDDELFPPEYRGIGIRIEDDVLVTEDGCINLSADIPSHPDDIEAWMQSLR